jgi:hypothetical protein
MDRAISIATLTVLALALLVPACHRSGGGESFDVEGVAGVVDPGEPFLAAADGHVGSRTCGACHEEVFADWLTTFHNVSIRETDRPGATGDAVVGDADDNGVDDFRDGLDLAGDPDFAAFGANAPKLLYVANDPLPRKVRIGAVSYDVWRTIGGNGFWRQRYLTRVGASVFTLPVEYQEATDDWVPYEPEDWYDGGGNPRFATAAAAEQQIEASVAFDLGCAGCHSTGFDVEFDVAQGKYVSGYQELTVGCEACHGPGKAHADSGGDPRLIENPAYYRDGTEEGAERAALVCGRCHNRGRGGKPANGAHPTGYPWREGSSTFPVGAANFEDYFTTTSDPADYWRYKDNPLGFSPTPSNTADDTNIAGRAAELQYPDYQNGVHATSRQPYVVCFSCHDPHKRTRRHQIREELSLFGTDYESVSTDNNKLCLVCHHGFADFAGITDTDVQDITDASAPSSVVNAVVDHMRDKAAMPVGTADYDPTGTEVGRCLTCHMLFTSLSGAPGADAAGNLVGDIHNHTFQTIWPNVSELTEAETGGAGVTNSCSTCHPLHANDEVATIIEEWVSNPDGDSAFHPDTPRSFQNGVANPTRLGGVACVACHTTQGFLDIQVNGSSLHDKTSAADAEYRSEVIAEAIKRDHGITCNACHGKRPDGTFAGGGNPLRFSQPSLCGRCHNNQTVLFEDYVAEGEIVRHPQREMYAGLDGAEVPGKSYDNSAHTLLFFEDCTACHFRTGANRKHDFEPTIESCQTAGCHETLTTFNRTAGDNYDGDLTVEGIQDEIDGCVAILETAILGAPTSTGAVITFDGTYWLIDGAEGNTAALDATADAALLRAMFNHYWVRFDGSRGLHNPRYALQLIQNSYEELTQQSWPGVKRN